MHVLLVGAGNMAIEYAKILNALHVEFTVIGRGEKSAACFEQEIGKKVEIGGLEAVYDRLMIKPTHAIISTTLESLEENALFIVKKVQYVLIEKPGAVNIQGMKKIVNEAKSYRANVYIAYNRRFYRSVMEAEKLIEHDGGLKSFLFEFTEWSHTIEKLNKTEFQLNHWFIGNSTHVIDTAFFFGGKPIEMSNFVSNPLTWHPKGSLYSGAGITEKGILFSYHANWKSPGSWKLELLTDKNRYIFRPFEKLHVQQLGSLTINEVEIDDEMDIKFKPGLYEQVRAFLYNTHLSCRLLSAEEGLEMMGYYVEMNGERK